MKPYYTDDLVTLYHGDCREVLGSLPPADLLLTDPPYGLPPQAAVWRRNGTAIEDWRAETHNMLVEDWRAAVTLAQNAWIAEFGAGVFSRFLVPAHEAAEWVPATVYALVKSAPAPTARPGFANAIELALVSRKGKPQWHGTNYEPNRWIGLTPNRAGTDLGHPTQKPQEPIAALVRVLAPIGGFVVDPFAGSGTTLRAAKDEGRKGIGVEIDERYCEIAAKRLGQDNLFGGVA